MPDHRTQIAASKLEASAILDSIADVTLNSVHAEALADGAEALRFIASTYTRPVTPLQALRLPAPPVMPETYTPFVVGQ